MPDGRIRMSWFACGRGLGGRLGRREESVGLQSSSSVLELWSELFEERMGALPTFAETLGGSGIA